jgi:hypothetical protein
MPDTATRSAKYNNERWGDGLTPLTLSSRAPVGRTAAGPLAFRGSLVGEEVVPTLPVSVGVVVASPNLSQIAGVVARAMGSIRRFCEVAWPAPLPVPESVLVQVGQTRGTMTENRARPRR